MTHRGSEITFVVADVLVHTAEYTPAPGVFPTACSNLPDRRWFERLVDTAGHTPDPSWQRAPLWA
jgi:hypothetical protein